MKQRPSKRKAPEEPVKLNWRIVASIVVPLIIAAAVFATYLTVINGPKKLTDSDRAMLLDYDRIRAALHHDDLSAAKIAGAAFIQTHAGPNPFAEHASALPRPPRSTWRGAPSVA